MMGEHGATIGTARDLRARVILALIATRNGKPNGGRAAALMETARTIMTFITGEPEHDPVPEAANDTGGDPGAPYREALAALDGGAERDIRTVEGA